MAKKLLSVRRKIESILDYSENKIFGKSRRKKHFSKHLTVTGIINVTVSQKVNCYGKKKSQKLRGFSHDYYIPLGFLLTNFCFI